MNIHKEMKQLEVYFDGDCAMCHRFVKYFGRQDHDIDVMFLPYAGAEAKCLFPEIDDYEPDQLMVTRTDLGMVYRGAESWVLCLWTVKRYRWLARILGSWVVLPILKMMAWVVARNRKRISTLIFGKDCGCGDGRDEK